ncbi:MAG: protein-L-isoaspartate(D-aspartate) O-methyltransferase [Candidatus Marinimicrobia bacterium]|nr:protein-L-isoaspartate(D-aspartate) O-methyltransferase [Candidatus Neomarinimicrobiota bacterium]
MRSGLDYDDAYELRQEMVERQLADRGIYRTDILEVFQDTPRHLFIPDFDLTEAYADHPLPIKAGQTISQPYIVALMIQYLEPALSHKILEIGSGSGYATAILSKLCQHIDALEVYQALVEASRETLKQLSIANVTLMHKSAWEQMNGATVYDRIILWASPPRIPSHIFDRLGEGGILVAPEGKRDQYVWIYKKNQGRLEQTKKDAVRFVPLVSGSTQEIDGTMRGYDE